jgi:BRCT domain type II-containing protein
VSNSIKGKNICFTGKVDGFTREELKMLAKEYGFNFSTTVTPATDILVVGEKAGQVKINEALKLRIRQWKADDFIMMLGQDEHDGIPDAKVVSTPEDEAARKVFYREDETAGMF